MVTVFNKKTNLPDVVSDEELKGPNASNYQPIQDHTFGMVSKDGKVYDVPGVNLDKAVAEGWRLTTHAEDTHSQNVDHMIKEGAHGEGNNAFQAAVNAAANATGFSDLGNLSAPDSPEQQEAQAAIDAQHPIATKVGTVAGFGLSLAAGGELATGAGNLAEQGTARLLKSAAVDAAEQGFKETVAKKIAIKAAGSAAQGAVFSAPQAVAQAAYGDPEKAAETLLWGIGTGAVLGGGLSAASEAAGAAKRGLSSLAQTHLNPEALENKANELILKQSGISAADARKLGPGKIQKIASVLENEGLDSSKLTRDQVQKLADDAGSKIGEHMASLDKAIESDPQLAKLAFNPSAVADRIQSEIGASIPGLNTPMMSGESKALQDIADSVRGAAGERMAEGTVSFGQAQDLKSTLGKEASSYAERLRATQEAQSANAVPIPKSADAPISFKESQDVKSMLGSKAKFDTTASPVVNDIRKAAYQIVAEEQTKAADQVYQKLDSKAGNMADYLNQKQRYSVAQDLLKLGPQEFENSSFGKLIPSTGGNQLKHYFGVGMLGHAVSSVLGPLGTPAVWLADHFLGHWAEEKGLSYAASTLRKVARNPGTLPFVGSMMAKDGVESLSKRLDELPQLLKSAPVKGLALANPIKTFLGPEANGLSKEQQYDRMAQNITRAAADPDYVTTNVGHLVSVFGNDTRLANLVAQKNYNAITYLHNILPKNPSGPEPFSTTKWKASSAQVQDFTDVLSIIQNPMSAIHGVANNSLTAPQVDALKTIYPSIYSEFQKRIAELAHDPANAKMPYGKKVKLSLLTGQNLDPSLAIVPQLQQNYSQGAKNQQAAQEHGSRAPKLGNLPSYQTESQRLQSK